MQKIILFGGTFDPPHNGHMALLAGAVRTVQPDLVIVEPAGIPPHKAASATPADLRLAMCECFVPLAPRVQLDDTEIRRGGKSYTVDTLRALRERCPAAQFYLPMGSDMLLYFRHWQSWQEILRMAALVVQCRRDADEAPVRAFCRELRQEGARILLAQGRVVEVSSTEIRARAAAGDSVAHLVPPGVEQIILSRGLYRQQQK